MAAERKPGRTRGPRLGIKMFSQNPAYDVFVDLEAEGERNLLGNSRAAPTGIAALHFKDGIDQFFARSLRARSPFALARKQHAILLFCQHLVEM